MPHIKDKFDKAAEAKCFCNFDLTHGYWKLLIHEESQECQSFITPVGIPLLTRVLHGNLNANSHPHDGLISALASDLKDNLLIWLIDLAIAVKDDIGLLEYITKLLDFIRGGKFQITSHQMSLYQNVSYVRWTEYFSRRHQFRPTSPFKYRNNHDFIYRKRAFTIYIGNAMAPY